VILRKACKATIKRLIGRGFGFNISMEGVDIAQENTGHSSWERGKNGI